jgi:hypothetical protein
MPLAYGRIPLRASPQITDLLMEGTVVTPVASLHLAPATLRILDGDDENSARHALQGPGVCWGVSGLLGKGGWAVSESLRVRVPASGGVWEGPSAGAPPPLPTVPWTRMLHSSQ